MGHHHHHHHHHHEDSPYDDPLLACCCCPCLLVSSMLRGFGRCIFAACYPLLRCFGLDDHHHHHHSFWSLFDNLFLSFCSFTVKSIGKKKDLIQARCWIFWALYFRIFTDYCNTVDFLFFFFFGFLVMMNGNIFVVAHYEFLKHLPECLWASDKTRLTSGTSCHPICYKNFAFSFLHQQFSNWVGFYYRIPNYYYLFLVMMNGNIIVIAYY